ncbi:MAG: MFS transporter [Deltaproteobacteria bacterium]|nr:MAG: MFS transporter [Deltaproteobacteria bacterium]
MSSISSDDPRRAWVGPFIFLNVLMFLVFSNIAFFYLYPLFLQAMGSTKTTIGWVMGLMPISTVVTRPYMGKLVARRGEQPVIVLGLLIIFFSSLAYHGLKQVAWPMILVRIAHGVGFSAFISASYTAVAQWVPQNRRGQAYSYTGATILAAVAIMPLAGEHLVKGFGYPALFNGAAAAVFLAGLLTFAPVASRRVTPSSYEGELRYGPLLRRRSTCLLLLAILLFVQGHATVLNFIALQASRLGLPPGYYFAVAASLAFVLRLVAGAFIDRYGKKRFMKGSYVFFGAGICLIPLISHSPAFYASSLLYGTGLAFLFPAAIALAADQAKRLEELPGMLSLATATFDMGFISGSVLSGWFADLFTLDILFFTVGALSFVGFALMFSPIHEAGAS